MVRVNRPVYIVSSKTQAIIAKDSDYYRARILEVNNEKLSIHKPEQIIDHSCLIYGSSLKGRRTSVKDILKSATKLPIPVIPDHGVYMIPTASVKNKHCVWVAYHHIDIYEQRDDKTYIMFKDHTGIYVNTSRETFDSQYKRACQVILHLNWHRLFGRGFPIL